LQNWFASKTPAVPEGVLGPFRERCTNRPGNVST